MLNLLTLPIIWLGFFIVGSALVGCSLTVRRYAICTGSLALLLVTCGLKTWSFYVALSLGIILAGFILNSVKNEGFRKILFIVSVATIVITIVVFLKWRIYFQKNFIYLPSLSYLGFRGIAYLNSIYKQRFFEFSLALMQMMFLPMLIMGPISRVENFEKAKQDYDDVLRRLLLGLSMLVLGHYCCYYVLPEDAFSSVSGIHWSAFWVGALANSFHIYFIFSGYTHMIIGLGLLVGFKLPENFNNPYFATSISEFWRRWHMSLSFWIRDYLYFPLGGNRKGITRKCLNLFIALGICGIWHGLSWHYLFWGLYHGALLCVESLMVHVGFSPLRRFTPSVYKPIKITITFTLVTFGWILFKYPIFDFIAYTKGMIP